MISVPSHIASLLPYQPGKSAEEIEREFGIAGAIKLASNENPLGSSPFAIDAIQHSLSDLAFYPDAGRALRFALADRFVVEAALAVANGRPVPEPVQAAFDRLPVIMQKADALAGQIARAVIDLAEAVSLSGREGERFDAVVTDVDQRGARIQLCSPPVVARIKANGLKAGDELTVQLDSAEPGTRSVLFSVVR